MQHIVRQRKPSPTSKRCSKQEEHLKQAKEKDNLPPGTQIISMATVMHVMNLDINLLNVNWVQKGKKNYTSAQTYLGKIRCYVCLKLGHKAKYCKLRYALKSSRQMMESNQINQSYG